VAGQAGRALWGGQDLFGGGGDLLDEKFALPWLSPQRERLLSMIFRARLRGGQARSAVIGIMSGCRFLGTVQHVHTPGERRAEEWSFVTELKKDFAVRGVALTATEIDGDIKVLVVAHPVDITDATQYAIDQFVLRAAIAGIRGPSCLLRPKPRTK